LQFSALSTEDIVFDHPIGAWNGQAELALGTADGLGMFAATQHLISNILITQLDLALGTATVSANLICTHVYRPHPSVVGTDVLRDYTQMGAPYLFELRREGGVWRISKNVLTATWFYGKGVPM
jgi:hypothetical protein